MRLAVLTAALLLATPALAQPAPEARLRFTLSGTLDSGQPTTDWAFLRFLPDALPGWDRHDASKYSSAPAQIAFVGRRDRQRVRLGMNAVPDGTAYPLPSRFNTKLEITTRHEGTFTLAWDGALAPGWRATLVDRDTGAKVRIWRESSYTFRHKASEWVQRFHVRVEPGPDATGGLVEAAPTPASALAESTSEVGSVSPNPAASAARLSVSLAEEQPVRVALYDALGREAAVAHDGALSAGAHRLALPTAGLPPGLYVVRITGGSLSETRRLTIAR